MLTLKSLGVLLPTLALAMLLTAESRAQVKAPPAGPTVQWDWQIGASSPAAVVAPTAAQMIDIDGFESTAAEVAALKAKGLYTVCYIDAGSWESGRPDSSQYPTYLKIYFDAQWNEWFLDVTDVFKPGSVLAKLLTARFQMCKDKGFDAVEPDNQQNDENTPGLITTQQALDFRGWLGDTIHALGMAAFQKNAPDKVLMADRGGVLMVNLFDGIINEECQRYTECAGLAEYVKRGKLAVDVEYRKRVALDCAQSKRLGVPFMLKDLNLAGAKDRGYLRTIC